MLAWLAPLIVFGLVVFVHELGHFLAAKATGVYAPRFSIGFGPALLRKRWGETEYILAALPLGGYVRMASREDETMALLEGGGEKAPPSAPHQGAHHQGAHPGVLAEVAGEAAGESRPRDWDPEAMYPFGPKPVPEHRWFESKPLWARLVIMLAGVTMNVLLALVVSIALFAAYGRPVVPTRTVGAVTGPAASAFGGRLVPGDTILRVGEAPVRNWGDAQRHLLRAPAPLTVVTQRGSVAVNAGAPGSATRRAVVAGLDYHVPPVIDSVVGGMPAARAGLQRGDSVVAFDGRPVASFAQVSRAINDAVGRDVSLGIVRHGRPLDVTVHPESAAVTNPETGESEYRGRIGIVPPPLFARERVPLGEAVVQGWDATWAMTGQVVDIVKRLVHRDVSVKQLGGPIAIVRSSVAAAREGVEALFYLVAFLSVNVAVLNLLPIPILDGGQVLINVAEAVKGRAFSPRTREYILRAGLVAIGLLFVTVMWNDISRIISDVIR
jgi:regulator of sigma E protease